MLAKPLRRPDRAPVHTRQKLVHFLFRAVLAWQALPEQRIGQAADRPRERM
jgi:hypothetical protein